MSVYKLFFVVLATFLLEISCFPHAGGSTNGGHAISIKNAPFMAMLRNINIHPPKVPLVCAAIIVHKQFILTSVNCALPGLLFEVVVGTGDVYRGGQIVDLERVYPHETKHIFDVYLMKLMKPLTFNAKVNQIKLPHFPVVFPNTTKLNITGWGYSDTGLAPKLQQTEVPLMANHKCGKLDPRGLAPIYMCAGALGRKSCKGIGGSPLTVDDTLVGMVIEGEPSVCGQSPALYLDIYMVVSWIKKTMKSLE